MAHLELRSEALARRLAPILEALAVCVFTAAMLDGFRNQLDLHPMDEAHYLSQGRAILSGDVHLVSLGWSPVTSAAYAGLLLVPLGDVLLPDAMLWLTSVLSALAAWWLLRGIVPPVAAVLGACWWAASLLALEGRPMAPPSCYAFTAATYFLGLGLLQRRQPGAACLLLGLTALNRGELAPPLLVAGGLVAWLGARGEGRTRRWGLALSVTCLAILVIQFANEDCRARGWIAFQDSYGSTRHETSSGSPLWRDDSAWHDFPGANSLTEAIRVNPAAFVVHVRKHLEELPKVLWELVDFMWHLPILARAVQISTVALAVLALVLLRDRLRIAARAVTPAVWCVLGASMLMPASVLIMLLQPDYLRPMWAAFALAVILPASVGCEFLRHRFVGTWSLRAWGPCVVPLLVIVAALLLPDPFLRFAGPHRDVRESVHMLRRAELPAGTCVWARYAPGLLAVIGREDLGYVDLYSFQKPGTTELELEEALRASPPDYVLLTDRAALGAVAEPLTRLLVAPRWSVVDVSPGLTAFLYKGSP